MDKYIYKTKFDHTVVLKPTTFQAISDPTTGKILQYLSTKPIKLVFRNLHCIIDEDFAKLHDLTLEQLAHMISKLKGFGHDFVAIHTPEKAAKVGDVVEMKKAAKKKPLVQGVRNR